MTNLKRNRLIAVKPEVISVKSSADSDVSKGVNKSKKRSKLSQNEEKPSSKTDLDVKDGIRSMKLRSSPNQLCVVMTGLTPIKQQALKDFGFGSLVGFNINSLPGKLVYYVVDNLLYSDWKRDRGWRTFKRPGVDDFLEHLAQLYEIIVYSDQQSMYVDPIVDRLDGKHCIRYRLSRAATIYQDGKHYRFHRFATHILLHSGGDVHEVPGALRNKLKLC